MPDLTRFFQPGSIAVLGASEREGSMGAVVMKNLQQGGFDYPLYAVNLKGYNTVFGVPCYRYVRQIPHPVDLAVLCLPHDTVPRVLRQLARKGTRAVLVLTGGLARHRTVGTRLNKQIERLAAELDIRVLGPNSLGILVPDAHLNASYAHLEALPGSAAYVGHSAALGSALLDWAGARGIGFSHFLTTGASADLRISDVIDYLATDRRVRAILVHLEHIRDANRLLIAMRAAARSKKVLAIRTRTQKRLPAGLTNRQAVDDEYFTRAGVLQVDSVDGLFRGLEALSRARPLHRANLAIVSNGLGTAMLARQHLEAMGGELATVNPLSDDPGLLWYAKETGGNPAILPPQATGKDYVQALRLLEKDPKVGGILVVHSPNLRSDSNEVAHQLLPYIKKSRRMILTCFLGGLSVVQARQRFDGAGLLNFDSPNDAVDAYMTLARHELAQERLRETPSSTGLGFKPDRERSLALVAQVKAHRRRYLTWAEARSLVRLYGFQLVDSTFGTDFDQVVQRLTPRYFPASLRLVHEAYCYPFAYNENPAERWRGVRIELNNEQELRQAFEELQHEKKDHFPDSRTLGWGVQPMRRKIDHLQFSLGVTRDEDFGPLILFGEGGSRADMLADRQVALPPLNASLARQMIMRSHGYQVLAERSTDLEADLFQLIRALKALAQMVIDLPELAGLEINVLLEPGANLVVLGAAACLGEPQRPALNPYPTEWVERQTLANEKTVTLRPIRGEDEPALKRFYTSFDADSLRLRFFGSRLHFEHRELATLCQIDYRREMVFVAIHRNAIVGEMRLWHDVNHNALEFAIMVALGFQGTGLASRLMRKTIDYARHIGVARIVADVLPENTAMLALGRRFHFQARFEEEGIIHLTLELDAERPDNNTPRRPTLAL
ncbi:MAG: bifunctional acetate--CoA ligase family protein/GNAT family N-acetyltransferase [Saccharospirillum sp.]